MSRGRSTFRERDVSRAIRAARKAGVEVARIKIEHNGTIVVEADKPAAASANSNDEWHQAIHGEKT